MPRRLTRDQANLIGSDGTISSRFSLSIPRSYNATSGSPFIGTLRRRSLSPPRSPTGSLDTSVMPDGHFVNRSAHTRLQSPTVVDTTVPSPHGTHESRQLNRMENSFRSTSSRASRRSKSSDRKDVFLAWGNAPRTKVTDWKAHSLKKKKVMKRLKKEHDVLSKKDNPTAPVEKKTSLIYPKETTIWRKKATIELIDKSLGPTYNALVRNSKVDDDPPKKEASKKKKGIMAADNSRFCIKEVAWRAEDVINDISTEDSLHKRLTTQRLGKAIEVGATEVSAQTGHIVPLAPSIVLPRAESRVVGGDQDSNVSDLDKDTSRISAFLDQFPLSHNHSRTVDETIDLSGMGDISAVEKEEKTSSRDERKIRGLSSTRQTIAAVTESGNLKSPKSSHHEITDADLTRSRTLKNALVKMTGQLPPVSWPGEEDEHATEEDERFDMSELVAASESLSRPQPEVVDCGTSRDDLSKNPIFQHVRAAGSDPYLSMSMSIVSESLNKINASKDAGEMTCEVESVAEETENSEKSDGTPPGDGLSNSVLLYVPRLIQHRVKYSGKEKIQLSSPIRPDPKNAVILRREGNPLHLANDISPSPGPIKVKSTITRTRD